MGAIVQRRKLDWMTTAELHRWFDAARQESLYEEGHDGYSGGLGTIHDFAVHPQRVFTDEDSAWDFLEENVGKRSAAAVTLIERKARLNERDQALVAKLEDEIWARSDYLRNGTPGQRRALERAPAEILAKACAAVMTGKSRFRTCPKCESKIAVVYLARPACPVCASELLIATPTVRKAIEAAQNKLAAHDAKTQKIRDRIKEIHAAAPYDEVKHWLVCAVCAS